MKTGKETTIGRAAGRSAGARQREPWPSGHTHRLGATKATGLLVLAGLLSLSAGCLNPEFVNQIQSGNPIGSLIQLYPTTPGEEPFVMVRIFNDTASTLDIPITFDKGAGQVQYTLSGISPEFREIGVLLDWPVIRIGLGNLDDPWEPSIVASLPNGGGATTVPFGWDALEAGRDFSRGDTVVFHIVDDGRSPSAIRVSPGLIDADNQPRVFAYADPFEGARLVLALYGF